MVATFVLPYRVGRGLVGELRWRASMRDSRVSIQDIAQASGVSKAAVSFALQNKPKVSFATRERILRVAQELGYTPDARLSALMTCTQGAKSKDLLPIAWLNTLPRKDAWAKQRWLTPYVEGAEERARKLGYRLEMIWVYQAGMTMKRISQIIYERGIEGVVVTAPAKHLRLKWDLLASVALDGDLLAPGLHNVSSDRNFNMITALKMLRRYGYRRIGICLPRQRDYFPQLYHPIANTFLSSVAPSDRIPPVFYPIGDGPRKDAIAAKIIEQFATWVRRFQPEVIIGGTTELVSWIRATGLRVPEDIGVVHLWLDDDASDWAGIHSNKWEMGAVAADMVISMAQSRRFGLPPVPLNILVRGRWQCGKTLITPKERDA